MDDEMKEGEKCSKGKMKSIKPFAKKLGKKKKSGKKAYKR